MKKEATPKCNGLENKDLQWKKRQPQNIRGLKKKTSDEKRGNPKMQGAWKQRPRIKKRQFQNARDFKTKTSDEKWDNPKTQRDWKWRRSHKQKIKNRQLTEASTANLTLEGEGDAFWFHHTRMFNTKSHEGDPINQKLRTVSLLKLAPPT
jgi:hypothetical protein